RRRQFRTRILLAILERLLRRRPNGLFVGYFELDGQFARSAERFWLTQSRAADDIFAETVTAPQVPPFTIRHGSWAWCNFDPQGVLDGARGPARVSTA